MDIDKLQKLEKQLHEVGKIKLFKYITPINLKEQKEKCLNSQIDEPKFLYPDPDYDVNKTEDDLKRIIDIIPDNDLGKLLIEKGEEILLFNQIVKNIGNRDRISEISIKLYGKPSQELVKKAKFILKKVPKMQKADKIYSAVQAKAKIEDYLQQIGLTDWKVVIRDQASVSIVSLRRKIIIASLKRYSENDIKRLLVHEIDVHALRAENGHRQLLKIFARGLAGFLPTGDGIALYFEKQRGVMDTQREKEIALRVLAVDMVYKGEDFKEVFDFINEFEDDKDKCWEITYRVFRAGSLLKDHLYLQGYLDVLEYTNTDRDLKELYIGRIGLKHLAVTKILMDRKFLNKPDHLPVYLVD